MSGADTAWMLTSTVLVLFMTLPGLALFYAGLVRANNVLSVMMHCFALCLPDVDPVVAVRIQHRVRRRRRGQCRLSAGSARRRCSGVGRDSLSGTIPETVFFMFQMTFAIITPALIVGAYPERVRFPFVLAFSTIWLLVVYAPVTHWVWGGGWLADRGVMDFAGGIVVHATAGISALLIARELGPRRGFPIAS